MTSQFVAFDSILSQSGNDFMSCVYTGDTLCTVWGDTRNGKMNIYFSKTIASTNTNVGITLLEGEGPQWKIFPNPANDYLNVTFSNEMKGKEISVYDSSGKKIFNQTITDSSIKIQTQTFAKGVYFFKVGNEVKEFIKE